MKKIDHQLTVTELRKQIKYLVMGADGFPHGLGNAQKLKQVATALNCDGDLTLVLANRWGPQDLGSIPHKGKTSGIYYIYTCRYTRRPASSAIRTLAKIRSFIIEFALLSFFKQTWIITSGREFPRLLLYRLHSLIFRYKIAYTYVEDESILTQSGSWAGRLNCSLLKRYRHNLYDVVLPISSFLDRQANQLKPKPSMILPPLADFDAYSESDIRTKRECNTPYFYFCGSFAYENAIRFIINSFTQLQTESASLLITGGGCSAAIKRVRRYIEKIGMQKRIRLMGYLTEEEVRRLMSESLANLMPLLDTVQDQARFPQKSAEYAASGKPLLTHRIGDVPLYFSHLINAYIAENQTCECFADLMKTVLDDKETARRIGKQGQHDGRENFDTLKYGPKLANFLEANVRITPNVRI